MSNQYQGGFLINKYQDQYLYEVNRNSFNRIGSDAVFQENFGNAIWEPDRLNVIIGTDSGLLVSYMLRRGVPEGSRYLFVELDDILPAIVEKLSDSDLGDRISITDPDGWWDRFLAMSAREYSLSDGLRLYKSIGCLDAYIPAYRELMQEVKSNVDKFSWRLQFELGSQAFVVNQLIMSADAYLPAGVLKGAFIGKTAVIMAGGPSLDDALPWIKQHREDLLLIAVSRVSRLLIEKEIEPDIVVSVDPYQISFDVSREMLKLDQQVIFLHSNHVTPRLGGQWKGRSLYLRELLPWRTPLNKENIVASGPTVTNGAFQAAVDFGIKQIILTGVDLCYTREGRTYASGTNESDHGMFFGETGIQVVTNGGWPADSPHDFVTAADILSTQVEAAIARGCRVINPAESAVRIEGVDFIPFQEIEIDSTTTTARDRLNQLVPWCGQDERITDLKALKQEMKRMDYRLNKVKTLCTDALSCIDGLFGSRGKRADFKYKKRLDKIEKQLDAEYSDISPLVKMFNIRSFQKLTTPDKDREKSDQELETWGRAYYETYRDSASTLTTHITRAIRRIDMRLAELHSDFDIDVLLTYWQENKEPNRAALWLSNNNRDLSKLSTSQQQRFSELQAEFDRMMNTKDTYHVKLCDQRFSLDSVRSKAALLFQKKDISSVENLVEGMSRKEDSPGQQIFSLCAGYLAELKDDTASAIEHYSQVSNLALEQIEKGGDEDGDGRNNPVLEDALKRLSSITLGMNDADNALLVLDSLASISPAYEPQYAQLLLITGNISKALDVYADYIEKAPNDLATMIKVCQLFIKQGQRDTARSVLEYVLQNDPENRAARQLMAEAS